MNVTTFPKTQQNCWSKQLLESESPKSLGEQNKDMDLIARVLHEDNLCCPHDMVLLNKHFDEMPQNQREVSLKKLISKIETILESIAKEPLDPVADAKNLILLYHFRDLTGKKSYMEQLLASAWTKFAMNPATTLQICNLMPSCASEIEFHAATTFFVGPNPTEENKNILRTRKIELRSSTKPELSKDHPPYLEELFNAGHIHLYDHLVRMKQFDIRIDRCSEIQNMTFSQAAHIVLEIRTALIQKVENAIPKNYKNCLFLLGGSGAGKSTTLCLLRGDKMEKMGNQYESKSDKGSLIGHELSTSCTFFPNVEVIQDANWVLVDFPGFEDSHGPLIALGMELALKALVAMYHPKIMVLETITNLGGRAVALQALKERLTRIVDDEKKCLLGITKYSQDPDFEKSKTIEMESVTSVTEEEYKLEVEIKTLSDLIATLPSFLARSATKAPRAERTTTQRNFSKEIS